MGDHAERPGSTDDSGSRGDRRTGPLHGLVVADFSRILAGPYCTMLLADLGATVIKVESRHGDDTRSWTPPVRDGMGIYFMSANRNKRSIALDLNIEVDRRIAGELAQSSDVLVENFRPDGLARFGLDYEDVAPSNPSLIYCSITGFGRRGGRDIGGYDLLAQAMSGLMSLQGDADGPAFKVGTALVDVLTGLHAAVGILAALRHREDTGEGQRVEVNLLSTALASLVNQATTYVGADIVPRRNGNHHPNIYPYQPMPTSDGELVVIAANDRQFQRLCDALGFPEVAADPRFCTVNDRNVNRDALAPILQSRLEQRTTSEWFETLTWAGVICGPINTVRGGFELAQRLGLEPIVPVGPKSTPTVRNPMELSRTPVTYRHAAPDLDADRNWVTTWLHNRRRAGA